MGTGQIIIFSVLFASVISVLATSLGLAFFSFFTSSSKRIFFFWELLLSAVVTAVTITGFRMSQTFIYLLFLQQFLIILVLSMFVLEDQGYQLNLTIKTLGGGKFHLARMLFSEYRKAWKWMAYFSGVIVLMEYLLRRMPPATDMTAFYITAVVYAIFWGILLLPERGKRKKEGKA